MSHFAQLLKERDLKATFQRMTILSVIEEMGHMDVDEIYVRVLATHPTLSLATVYKNIVTMSERGVLVEVPISGKKSKYEIKKHEHVHLICRECGSVVDQEIDEVLINDTQAIARKSAFALEDRHVSLYGVCAACREVKAS
jgi:Fur family ferric uptake transcriptional regulator/Fur family peroxide stress response transcriptional regulator